MPEPTDITKPALPEQGGTLNPSNDHQAAQPATSFRGVLPPHARDFAGNPVRLETRGLTSQWQQGALFENSLIWKDTIAAKLCQAGAPDLAKAIRDCHTERSFAQCTGCHKHRTFWNRCDLFYCPSCQPRLARERGDSIEWWSKLLQQPKHVVLTTRNTETLTWDMVKQFKRNLTRLRRAKIARNWTAGCWSLEVTNEGKGWHLHAHLLIEAKWIDKPALATKWADLVGQDFAIVAVKDCRDGKYLKEVTKYAVKGSQLAGWQGADILQFVLAFRNQRCFGVFGDLYGKRTLWREWIDSLREHGNTCDCGCSRWKVYSESEWEWKQTVAQPIFSPRPPPTDDGQLTLT